MPRFTRQELEREIGRLGPWFHNLEFDGVNTAPNHFLGDFPRVKWRRFAHAVPGNLSGKAVLDIGCNGGFYSLEMKRRGAARVLGIDSDPGYLAQARFAAAYSGLEIEFREMSVYQIGSLQERFDLVLFLGVLYHLRYPLLALDLIRQHVAGNCLIFQSMLRGDETITPLAADYPFEERQIFNHPGAPRMQFVEHSFAGDPSNWWIPNRAAVEAMLRSSGFEIIARPEDEVYLCQCAPAISRQLL